MDGIFLLIFLSTIFLSLLCILRAFVVNLMPNLRYRYMAGLAMHDGDLVATTVSDSYLESGLALPPACAIVMVSLALSAVGTRAPKNAAVLAPQEDQCPSDRSEN